MTTKQIIEEELNQLKVDIVNRHVKAGQRATGATINSLDVRNVTDISGELWGADYIGVLEKGRKAGKVPYNFKDILIKWARAKGIKFGSQRELDKFAYFLSKKIEREGTERYGKNVDIFTTPIKEMTKRLSKRIAIAYATEIKQSIYEAK